MLEHAACWLDAEQRKWNAILPVVTSAGYGTTNGSLASSALEAFAAFDANPAFGPKMDMTRMKRWERAYQLGLYPPKRVFFAELARIKKRIHDATSSDSNLS
jgi:hypothetical protein